MPIADKIEAAKKIGEFLQQPCTNSGLHLKYRITVDPPASREPRLGASGNSRRVRRARRSLVDRTWRRTAALVRIAGARDAAPAGQRARKGDVRLPRISLHAARRTSHGGASGCGKSSQDRSALSVRSHVVARTAHRASRACATRKIFALRVKAKDCVACLVVYPRDYKAAAPRPMSRRR